MPRISLFSLFSLSIGLVVGGANLSPSAFAQQFEFIAATDGSLDDAAVLERASELNVDQLLELLAAYDRLGKKEVNSKIADEILKKDPANAQALRVKEGKPLITGVEPAVTEADRFAVRIAALHKAGRYREIISLIEERKRAHTTGVFPFQEDLADAYQQSGNTAAARRAYRELLAGGYPAIEKAGARSALADMEKADLYREVAAALKRKDPDAALEMAEGMIAKWPTDKDVVALKAVCISEQGKHDEALAILEDMKAKHKGGKFPYDVDIAGVLLAAKRFDQAEAMYVAMGGKAGAGGLRELEKSKAIEATYESIRKGHGKEALAQAEELAVAWPKDPDVAVLRGSALLAAGQAGEAAAELIAAKDQYYMDSGYYPGQGDLALSLHKSSDLEAASAAYGEMLDGSGYSIVERNDAVIQRRAIRRELNAGLNFDAAWGTEDEGDIFRATFHGHTKLSNGWRAWGWGHADFIDLSSEAVIAPGSYERYEGGIAVEHRGSVWDTAVRLGGHEDGVIAGFTLGRTYQQGTSWSLEGIYGDRAEDSLSLEALNGRENRIELGFEHQFNTRWALEAAAYYRWVEIDGGDIGDGWGGYANLDYTVVEAQGRRPAFRVGYAGEVHIFNGGQLDSQVRGISPGLSAAERSLLINDFIEPEINLHGIRAVVDGGLGTDFGYYLSAAAQYDFYDEEIQYSLGLGAEQYLTDKISLVAGIEYYSAGQAASSSSGVFLANVGLAIVF